jgi:hypothetical protein
MRGAHRLDFKTVFMGGPNKSGHDGKKKRWPDSPASPPYPRTTTVLMLQNSRMPKSETSRP